METNTQEPEFQAVEAFWACDPASVVSHHWNSCEITNCLQCRRYEMYERFCSSRDQRDRLIELVESIETSHDLLQQMTREIMKNASEDNAQP